MNTYTQSMTEKPFSCKISVLGDGSNDHYVNITSIVDECGKVLNRIKRTNERNKERRDGENEWEGKEEKNKHLENMEK